MPKRVSVSVAQALRPRRGRPRKFGKPARAVTLTLPEEVITALGAVDPDLSRAVVQLAQPALAGAFHPPAELAAFGGRAVIVVRPSRVLEREAGIVLVPLSDSRALISFDESMTVADIELAVRDALASKRLAPADVGVFASVADLLKQARHTRSVTIRRRCIIVLESAPAARRGAAISVLANDRSA